jgi:AcrR family transcriptional regulator
MAGEEQPKRQERAHRILDAAAELIQRWGYKKTTVDDIARQAGVAKGTIYLHWKTREDLFVALLLRESLDAYTIMQERIDSDPEGMYLSHVTKHVIAVVMERPLMKAIFARDITILGELLQSGQPDLDFLTRRKMVASEQLVLYFRNKGALRTDRSLLEQLKVYSAIVIGFMTVDQYLPTAYQSSPEEAVELLSQTIHETIEPAEPVAPEIAQDLRNIWGQFIHQYLQLLDERLQRSLA